MTDATTDARRSAIYLLDQILGENRLMSECLAAGALERLSPQDREVTPKPCKPNSNVSPQKRFSNCARVLRSHAETLQAQQH